MSWNVRRLNDYQKCQEVKIFILGEKPDLVCLQETKLSEVSDTVLREIIGTRLDSHAFILANGTAGGLILAWKSAEFTLLNCQNYSCCVTIDLKINVDNTTFRVTGVYGPSTTHNRQTFFQELAQSKPLDNTPWIACGDFNQTFNAKKTTRHSFSATH